MGITGRAAVAPTMASAPITCYGVGLVRVGMTVLEAEFATGEGLVVVQDVPGDEAPRLMRLPSAPTLLFLVEQGRIVRMETNDRHWSTLAGIRVGDPEASARARYRDRVEIEAHRYDPDGHNLIVRSPDGRRALVLETDGRVVVYIRAGLTPTHV
jgi:hypothetical protein